MHLDINPERKVQLDFEYEHIYYIFYFEKKCNTLSETAEKLNLIGAMPWSYTMLFSEVNAFSFEF